MKGAALGEDPDAPGAGKPLPVDQIDVLLGHLLRLAALALLEDDLVVRELHTPRDLEESRQK